MRIEIKDIEPMGAVRTTKAMAGKTAAGQKYATYKALVAWAVKPHVKDPLTGAIGASVKFLMPIPKSLKEKVVPGQMHTKKPDIDNLIKGLFDAVNGVLWVDDNRIANMTVSKVYSDEPGIILDVEEIGGLVHGQAEQPKQTEKAKQRTARAEKSRERRVIQQRV